MLFMAQSHVADNPFHAECQKLLEKLRQSPNQELPHSVLLKRMKMKIREFNDAVDTLVLQGDIELRKETTAGRTGRIYRLTEG